MSQLTFAEEFDRPPKTYQEQLRHALDVQRVAPSWVHFPEESGVACKCRGCARDRRTCP